MRKVFFVFDCRLFNRVIIFFLFTYEIAIIRVISSLSLQRYCILRKAKSLFHVFFLVTRCLPMMYRLIDLLSAILIISSFR